MTAPIMEVRNLTRVHRTAAGPLTVLTDVAFSVAAGETCAITGPSGSGKTTLLGLCAGLDLPTSGSVVLAGHDLTALNEDARAKLRNDLIGFVFQNFQLLPTLTALENVVIPLELRGGRIDRALARKLLEKVGLGSRLDHFPVQLSGGEQQRVALARAFIHHPSILFADEPTGNLDADSRAVVEDMLFTLNREAGTTLIIVTHDPALAARTGRSIALSGGRLVNPGC
ncbi:MAG TPA: ABC transporter ATP-binding protein [Verrucomicrobiales bacterium]|nr:ABC transporter ATP-binding protein [Verrucomicrobiales bacterium]